MFMVLEYQNVLLLGAYTLCPHEGKLQTDGLEFEDFKIKMLTESRFLRLRDIVRVFDQNTAAVSESLQ
jgi:hypothetical protein